MNLSLRLQRAAARAALGLPGPVLALAGAPPVIDGQGLDPQLTAGLAWAARFGPHLERLSPADARRASAATFGVFSAAPVAMASVHDEHAPGPAGSQPGHEAAQAVDRSVGPGEDAGADLDSATPARPSVGASIPVRIYVPRHHRGGLLVWFHGGGGVIGSIDSADAFVRDLAERAGCVIASVEYRLAPEHPHPAAIDDALAAWPWLVAHAARWGADPARVAVGGDSFGGFLAAWVERRAKAAGLARPRLCLLIYPLLDLTHASPSYQRFAESFGLTRPLIHWFRRHYAPEPATWRPGSPLFEDDVTDVAPTLLVAAGFDGLRDEGRAWAARVTAAGGAIRYRCHDSLIHGFIDMTGVCRAARTAVDELAADLAAALAR